LFEFAAVSCDLALFPDQVSVGNSALPLTYNYRPGEEHDGVTVRVPVQPAEHLTLTGKHQQGVQPGSRFDRVPGHQDVYFNADACRRLARLESVAARTGFSHAHLALAWALHQPEVASVLVGVRSPAHLEQALAAQAFDDRELFAELSA